MYVTVINYNPLIIVYPVSLAYCCQNMSPKMGLCQVAPALET